MRLVSILLVMFSLSILSAKSLVNGLSFIVNDTPVTLYEVYKMAEKRGVSKREAMEYVIQEKLREIEAKKLEIRISDYDLDQEIEKIASRNNLSIYGMRKALERQGVQWEDYRTDFYKKMLEEKVNKKIISQKMARPDPEELKGYYESNSELFSSASEIVAEKFVASDRTELEVVINNPMSAKSNVLREEMVIDTTKYSPQLTELLNRTPAGSFTPVIKVGEQSVAFYVREKRNLVTKPFEEVRDEVTRAFFYGKEKKIIDEYFERLRASIQVKMLRMPPEG